jgi:hypothetical protein
MPNWSGGFPTQARSGFPTQARSAFAPQRLLPVDACAAYYPTMSQAGGEHVLCHYLGNAIHVRVLEAKNLRDTQGWGGEF